MKQIQNMKQIQYNKKSERNTKKKNTKTNRSKTKKRKKKKKKKKRTKKLKQKLHKVFPFESEQTNKKRKLSFHTEQKR